MDPLSVNQRHFQRSNSNSACYNLSEIWNLPINGGGDIEKSGGGLNLKTPCFGRNSSMIWDVSTEDSASFEQIPVNGGCRKRGGGQDESSKGPSCSNGKRNKKSGSKEEGDETVKKDYIHVRARRGQATDSHSLAERARREKISERMKILQDIVPGCNKVIGKAVVLDEIINYIQSLQRQVEFLSMKIEAENSKPMSDNAMGEFPPKVVYAEQDYNATISAYRSQINREYDYGSLMKHEWLTGSFERSNRVKLESFSSTTNKTMLDEDKIRRLVGSSKESRDSNMN